MTIRYTCPECSSVLKIKDDLAGTGARCPKCKRKFVVPTKSQEDSAQITVEVDSDEHPARSHDNRKSRQKPSHDASLSSTEMTTISDDAPSSDAVAQVPNRPRKRSAGDESDSSHTALPVAENRKPLTDEFRTSGTVADTMHYHLEDDDSDATQASDTFEQNPNRPAKRSADNESDISDSTSPVAGTRKSLTNEIRTSPTVSDSPHFHLEDDESEDSREMVSTNQNGASANYHVDDDDDDLDSPAILVSIPIPDADSSLSSPTKKPKSSSFTPAFESPQASDSEFDLSTKKTVPRAFDPAKFLIEDEKPRSRPAPKSYLEDDDSDLGLSDDSGYDVLNPPTPQPPRRPSAPLATSRPAPEKVDLAAAAKMMKKAIKDAQSDATRVRQREANPGFDYGLFFREIGFRGLALIVGLAVMVFVCIQVGSYVFNSRLKTPPLARVTGHVTLDGQPLSNATVYFRPLDTTITKGRRDQARTSIGVTDEKGYFEMMYSPADRIRGVTVGTCFYWVDHVGDKGNDVPPNWMEFAQNTFDVKAGGNSDADIKMTSAKR